MTRRALVLGAGGQAASAWQIGLIAGMAQAGVDVRDAELYVGTSAGSRVGVALASGVALADLVARQAEPLNQRAPERIDWSRWHGEFTRAKDGGGTPADRLRRIGAFALQHRGASAPDRRQSVAAEIRLEEWPEKPLRIVAVEAESGERRVFDRDSGIALVDAVVASTAIAGMRPAVAFCGRHYFDGGFYSTDNADLAAGHDRVLILALRTAVPSFSVVALETAVALLERSGAQVAVVHPDDATQAVFASFGGNLLDPAIRGPAAAAAHAQGLRVAGERIAAFWM
jgi:NTE family protein